MERSVINYSVCVCVGGRGEGDGLSYSIVCARNLISVFEEDTVDSQWFIANGSRRLQADSKD